MAISRLKRSIGIVGGGFSGITSLLNLLYFIKINHLSGVTITLFDKNKYLGGIAYYKCAYPEHLMNIPLYAVDPLLPDVSKKLGAQNLLSWLCNRKKHKYHYQANHFCKRQVYGEYLNYLVQFAKESLSINCEIKLETDVVQIKKQHNQYVIDYVTANAAKSSLKCDAVILAAGYDGVANSDTLPYGLNTSEKYITNIWNNYYLVKDLFEKENILDKEILVIGSGLTAMDIIGSYAIALNRKTQPNIHKGHLYLVSRHGLLHPPIFDNEEYLKIDSREKILFENMDIKQMILELETIFSACKNKPFLIDIAIDGYVRANYFFEKLMQHPNLSEVDRRYIVKLYNKNCYTDVFATGMSHITAKIFSNLIMQCKLILLSGNIGISALMNGKIVLNLQNNKNNNHFSHTFDYVINAASTNFNMKHRNIFKDILDLCGYKSDKYVVFDRSGHIKIKNTKRYLHRFICIGPARIDSITELYGSTKSTARSIIELRLQSYEAANQLLYDLNLLTVPPRYFKRYPEFRHPHQKQSVNPTYDPYHRQLLNYKNLLKQRNNHYSSLYTFHADDQSSHNIKNLYADYIVSPDQCNNAYLPKYITASIFQARVLQLNNDVKTKILSRYFFLHDANIKSPLIVHANEIKIDHLVCRLKNKKELTLHAEKSLIIHDLKLLNRTYLSIKNYDRFIRDEFDLSEDATSITVPGYLIRLPINAFYIQRDFDVETNQHAHLVHFNSKALLDNHYYVQNKTTCIRGESGSGKTTFVKWLINHWKDSLPIIIYLSSEEILAKLPFLRDSCTLQDLILLQYAKKRKTKDSYKDEISDLLEIAENNKHITPIPFLVFLIDGYDELILQPAIKHVIDNILGHYTVIFTTRNTNLKGVKSKNLNLLPFSQQAITEFINLYQKKVLPLIQSPECATPIQFKTAFKRFESLYRVLGQNPLYLLVCCLLVNSFVNSDPGLIKCTRSHFLELFVKLLLRINVGSMLTDEFSRQLMQNIADQYFTSDENSSVTRNNFNDLRFIFKRENDQFVFINKLLEYYFLRLHRHSTAKPPSMAVRVK